MKIRKELAVPKFENPLKVPHKEMKRACKEYDKQYLKSGSKVLGLPYIDADFDDEISYPQQRWERLSRFQSGTKLERYILGDVYWAEFQRCGYTAQHFNADTIPYAVNRNWYVGIVKWFLAVTGSVVHLANNERGWELMTPQKVKLLPQLKQLKPLNDRSDEEYLNLFVGTAFHDMVEEIEDTREAARKLGCLTWEKPDRDNPSSVLTETTDTWVAELLTALEKSAEDLANYIQQGFTGSKTSDEWNRAFMKQAKKAWLYPNRHMHRHCWINPQGWDYNRRLPDGSRPVPYLGMKKPDCFRFHSDTLFREMTAWMTNAERDLFSLAVYRAALGKKTDLGWDTGSKARSLADWRFMVLLDTEPSVGKSRTLEILSKGFKALGLTVANFPHRIEAGFGFGCFANNMVLYDDLTSSDFKKFSNLGLVKSAISGATINSERKSKDAVEIESQAVLFASINGLTSDAIANSDAGILDRVIHITGKKYVSPLEKEVPFDDEQFTNGLSEGLQTRLRKQICGSASELDWEAELGEWFVSSCLWHAESVLTAYNEQPISSVVRKKLKLLNTPIGKTTAVQQLGHNISKLSALALGYLQHKGLVASEQIEMLLNRFDTGEIPVGLEQLSQALYLPAIAAGKLVSRSLIPKFLQDVCSTDFMLRSEGRQSVKTLTALKNSQGDNAHSKAIEALIASIQPKHGFLSSKVSTYAPVVRQECRNTRRWFNELGTKEDVYRAWNWVADRLENRPLKPIEKLQSTDHDEHNLNTQSLAFALVGVLD